VKTFLQIPLGLPTSFSLKTNSVQTIDGASALLNMKALVERIYRDVA